MAMAIAAPVFPEEMNADASPSRTSDAATRIDESRFRRRAWDGCSPISTTWEACRTVMGSGPTRWRASSRSMVAWSPTRTTSRPYSRAAAIAPSTLTGTPPSPPIASTAIFMADHPAAPGASSDGA